MRSDPCDYCGQHANTHANECPLLIEAALAGKAIDELNRINEVLESGESSQDTLRLDRLEAHASNRGWICEEVRSGNGHIISINISLREVPAGRRRWDAAPTIREAIDTFLASKGE